MDKTEIILAVLLVMIIALTAITVVSSQQETPNSEASKQHSWTKAICDKNNFCQDYEIECTGNQLVSMSPITGAFIQQDKTWQDPRTFEHRNRVCD